MEISEFHPDDAASRRDYVHVCQGVRQHDAPWDHELTEAEADGIVRYGWDLEPPTIFIGRVDGQAVGVAEYSTNTYDNQHLAWVEISVHPDHRRHGHGTELLEAMVERARAEGRTSLGGGGWELDVVRGFAAAHGFEQKAIEVIRRQHLDQLDTDEIDRRHAEALPHAAAYELVRLDGPIPEADLEAYARMAAAINDAPTDDLDIEDEAYPPERIRAYETAQQARGTLLRVFARHRETGEFAGQTAVAVEGERPWLAEQHDTSVVRGHRGHRLGLLLKLEMVRWLRERQPPVATVDTWNSASNDHMIEVNEALGYEVIARALLFQRPVEL